MFGGIPPNNILKSAASNIACLAGEPPKPCGTCPSNMRVCQFRHLRNSKRYAGQDFPAKEYLKRFHLNRCLAGSRRHILKDRLSRYSRRENLTTALDNSTKLAARTCRQTNFTTSRNSPGCENDHPPLQARFHPLGLIFNKNLDK